MICRVKMKKGMQDKTAGKRMKREDPGKESDEAMHFPSFTFQDMTEFLLKLQNVLFPLAPSLSLSFPVSALDFTFLSTLPISIDTKNMKVNTSLTCVSYQSIRCQKRMNRSKQRGRG